MRGSINHAEVLVLPMHASLITLGHLRTRDYSTYTGLLRVFSTPVFLPPPSLLVLPDFAPLTVSAPCSRCTSQMIYSSTLIVVMSVRVYVISMPPLVQYKRAEVRKGFKYV